MTQAPPNPDAIKGKQSVYDAKGERIFWGEWDPRVLATFFRRSDIEGARVLDIGANTAGLSLELARMGGDVVAAEPDPYRNSIALSRELITKYASEERLSLEISSADLFSAHTLGRFDVIVCFGLLYHFRNPQFVLDYLSSLSPKVLYLSTQTHPGDDIALVNRTDPKAGFQPGFFGNLTITGWHPTRPMLERMLQWAGFTNVKSLTEKRYDFPQKPPGATNSSYFRAELAKAVDPDLELRRYYPR